MWLFSYYFQKIKRIYRIRKAKFKSIRLKQIDDLFSGLQDVNDFLNESMSDYSVEDFIKLKYFASVSYDVRLESSYDYCVNNIENKNSIFLKKLFLNKKIKQSVCDQHKDKQYLLLYENINGIISDSQVLQWLKNNPDYNLEKTCEDCESKYPLLKASSTYYREDLTRDIVHYINLIDKEEKV